MTICSFHGKKDSGIWGDKAIKTGKICALGLSALMFIGCVKIGESITGVKAIDNLAWDQEPETVEVSEPVTPIVVENTDVEHLAMGIYTVIRDRNVSDNTAVLVGEVIVNRRDSHLFPNTIEGVVSQPYQFGDLSKGYDWDTVSESDSRDAIMAYNAAQEALDGSSQLRNDVLYVSDAEQGETVAMMNGLYFGR